MSGLENPEVSALLNDLYEDEWHWSVNYFCPTFKLREKKKVGSKYVKRYEKPRTPYARLLESAEWRPPRKRTCGPFDPGWIQSNCGGGSSKNCAAYSR